MEKCSKCDAEFPADELDAKPEPGSDPETADWTVLECRACYGPGFNEL